MKTLMVLLLLAGSAFAADIDGKWAGNMNTPGGDVAVGFTFKADGAKLTGTTSSPDGMEVKISDGKIEGTNVSFTVNLDFGGMPFMLSYKGVLAGSEIKFMIDVLGMPLELTVKKVS